MYGNDDEYTVVIERSPCLDENALFLINEIEKHERGTGRIIVEIERLQSISINEPTKDIVFGNAVLIDKKNKNSTS